MFSQGGYGGGVGPCCKRLRFVAAEPEFYFTEFYFIWSQSKIVTRWRCDNFTWRISTVFRE